MEKIKCIKFIIVFLHYTYPFLKFSLNRWVTSMNVKDVINIDLDSITKGKAKQSNCLKYTIIDKLN